MNEHGDGTGGFLAGRLRGAGVRQTIGGVMLESGGVVADQQRIGGAFRRYYRDLYGSNGACGSGLLSDFFGGLHIPTLSLGGVTGLGAPVQQQEILAAVGSLRSRGSPGPGGLPSEFCSAFADGLATV